MEVKFHRILKADPIGDPWGANGGMFQSFWCQFEGVEEGVKVNKKQGSTPSLVYGQFGYLVEQTTKSGKNAGNKYWLFKGMQKPEELEQPQYAATDAQVATSSPSSQQNYVHPSDQKDTPLWFAPWAIKINQIHEAVYVPEPPVQTEPFPSTPAPTTEPIGGGEITKDELENIFGGAMDDPIDLAEDGK